MNYTLAFKSLVTLTLFAALVPGVSLAQVSATLTATTHPASDVTETAARLNGYGAKDYSQLIGWFEWGTTASFGNQTPSRMSWGEETFKANLTDLKRGTRYYYRAVVVSGGETRYGETLSFTTKGAEAASASTGSSVGSTNTASAGSSSSSDSTKTTTTSKTSSTATTKTSTTAKTTASTASTDDDCATTTAALAGGTLAANAGGSNGGIGGLTIMLIVVVIALAIAAAVMQITAAREAARRKRAEQGMVLA